MPNAASPVLRPVAHASPVADGCVVLTGRGDDAAWGTLTPGTIVKSKFLRAAMTSDGLVIDDLSQKR